jgi:hypothetical protein
MDPREHTMEFPRLDRSLSGRRVRWGAALFALMAILAACAPGENPMVHLGAAGATPVAGFWLGLWHGAIVWVTLLVSLFRGDVSVYEVRNTGWPYNLGFVIGAGFPPRRRLGGRVASALASRSTDSERERNTSTLARGSPAPGCAVRCAARHFAHDRAAHLGNHVTHLSQGDRRPAPNPCAAR